MNRIYVIPHGDEILDLVDNESEIMNAKISQLARKDEADTKVIISPHGIRLSERIGIINTEFFQGYFKLKHKTLRSVYRNDRNLTNTILRATNGITEEVGFVSSSGQLSRFPLDFGTLIPLQFFKKTPIVYIGQPRFNDRKKLIEFGKSLYRVVAASDHRVSIIISADQAHTHSKDGPYGYSKFAAEYDGIIKRTIKENDFSELNNITDSFIEMAKPDSFWNMMILQGILLSSDKKMQLDYYYLEQYYGMMLAHSL